MDVSEELLRRVDDLIIGFDKYHNSFNKNAPFIKSGQYEFHAQTIHMRRESGNALAAINSREFIQRLWKTLKAWGIGSRGSHIMSLSEFYDAFQVCKTEIEELDQWQIDADNLDVEDVSDKIWKLIEGLKIVDNKATIVACTKALHHLLPELVVPMDRKYTQAFFMLYNPEFQYQQHSIFGKAFRNFIKIARSVEPARYVGSGWQTSRTKVIDNAIIGYCLSKGISGEKIR